MERVSPRYHLSSRDSVEEVVSVEDATPRYLDAIADPQFPTIAKILLYSVPFFGALLTQIKTNRLAGLVVHIQNLNNQGLIADPEGIARKCLQIREVIEKYKKCSLASNLISTVLLVVAAATSSFGPIGIYALVTVYGYLAYRDVQDIRFIQNVNESLRNAIDESLGIV